MTTTARPHSRTRRVDSRSSYRSRSAQRALQRRNRRLQRSFQVSTGAAVRNGGASRAEGSLIRGRSRQSIAAQLDSQSKVRKKRASKISFVAAILIVCFVGLGISLVLSSYVASQSETVVALEHTNKELKERDAQLTKELQENMSAAQLAEKAAAMGMVPARDVATLNKQGSKVVMVGTPKAAQGATLYNINPTIPERIPLKVAEDTDPAPEKVEFVKREDTGSKKRETAVAQKDNDKKELEIRALPDEPRQPAAAQ
ncbi:MAG TPA: hypothetical protein GX530_03895 [Corynebacteriales bacterium]|nr:hypothetical protein [Mycobacteriales bacterium]